MFIVFEGCDRSGKSTLSVMFQEALNSDKRFKDAHGDLVIDPHLGKFIWTKEPMFSSDEADLLNSPDYSNEFKRERLFLESRLKHQDTLASTNVVCDRYIWSGIAYAKLYSPKSYGFVKELYLNSSLFVPVDVHIFIDTPIEVCYERDPMDSLESLKAKREAFFDTMRFIRTPIIVMESVEPLSRVLEELVCRFKQLIDLNRSLLVI